MCYPGINPPWAKFFFEKRFTCMLLDIRGRKDGGKKKESKLYILCKRCGRVMLCD